MRSEDEEVLRELRAHDLAATPEELADRVAAAPHEPHEVIERWQESLSRLPSPPAPRLRAAIFGGASPPSSLVTAAVGLARGGDRPAASHVIDGFVTSRAGFSELLREGYRIGPDAWDETRLCEELARATRARLPSTDARTLGDACDFVAHRAVTLGAMMELSEGDRRRALVAELTRVARPTAGSSPYRPVAVSVTKHPQAQRSLAQEHGAVSVRLVDVPSSRGPTLLLISGHSSRIEEYEALLDRLEGKARLILVDLPGFGYSEKPEQAYSLRYYEAILSDVLAQLGVERCVVAGGGMGGNLALRLAYRDPARVQRVAAWSVAGWGEVKPFLAWGAEAFAHAPEWLFWTVYRKQAEQQYSDAFAEREAFIERGVAYRKEVYERTFQEAYFAIAAEQVGTSMLAHAAEIRAPALLLAGELDRGKLDVRGQVEHLAQAMGIGAVIVEGSGYAIANEKPDALAEHLARFLAGA